MMQPHGPSLPMGPPIDAGYEIELLKRSRLSRTAISDNGQGQPHASIGQSDNTGTSSATSEEIMAALFSKPDILFACTNIEFDFSDFFRFRPSVFLDAAYLSILRRPITGSERNKYEHLDFGGKANRIRVVKELASSVEGRQFGVKIHGRWLWQTAYIIYEMLYRDRVQ